jgi:hypothetical protein
MRNSALLVILCLISLLDLSSPAEVCHAPARPPDASYPMEAKNRLTVVMPWLGEMHPIGMSAGSAFVVATRRLKAQNCTSLRWDLLAVACNHSQAVLARVSL